MATNPILSVVDQTRQQYSNQATQASELEKDTIQRIIETNNITDKLAQNAITQTRATQAITTQKENLAKQIGNIFNTDVSAVNNVILEQVSEANTISKRKNDVGVNIEKKLKANFLDDPINYIVGRLTVDSDLKQYQLLQQQEDSSYNRIAKLNQLTDSTIVTNNNFVSTMNDVIAAAQLERLSLAADQEKIKTLGGVTEAKYKTLQIVNNLTAANYQLYASQTSIDLQNRQLALAQEQWAAQKNKLTVEDKSDEALGNIFLRGIQVLQPEKYSEFAQFPGKIKNYIQLSKQAGPVGEYYRTVLAAGLTGIVSPDAAELSKQLSNNAPIAFSKSAIRDIVTSAAQSVAAADAKNEQKARPEQLAVNINKTVSDTITTQSQEVQSNNPANIFSLPYMNELVKNVNGSYKSPFLVSEVIPLAEQGVVIDDKRAFQLLVDAVNNKNIPINQAVADFSFLYKKAVEQNLVSMQLTKYGIPLPESARQYNVRIGRNVFSYTDEAQLKRAVLLQRAATNKDVIYNRNILGTFGSGE